MTTPVLRDDRGFAVTSPVGIKRLQEERSRPQAPPPSFLAGYYNGPSPRDSLTESQRATVDADFAALSDEAILAQLRAAPLKPDSQRGAGFVLLPSWETVVNPGERNRFGMASGFEKARRHRLWLQVSIERGTDPDLAHHLRVIANHEAEGGRAGPPPVVVPVAVVPVRTPAVVAPVVVPAVVAPVVAAPLAPIRIAQDAPRSTIGRAPDLSIGAVLQMMPVTPSGVGGSDMSMIQSAFAATGGGGAPPASSTFGSIVTTGLEVLGQILPAILAPTPTSHPTYSSMPYGSPASVALPGGAVAPFGFEGSVAQAGGFRAGAPRVSPMRFLEARHPVTGRTVMWEYVGRPILFSRDLAAAKRVGRIAARAKSRARRVTTRRASVRRRGNGVVAVRNG